MKYWNKDFFLWNRMYRNNHKYSSILFEMERNDIISECLNDIITQIEIVELKKVKYVIHFSSMDRLNDL